MKRVITILLSVAGLFLIGFILRQPSPLESNAAISQAPPADIVQKAKTDEIVILDVRSELEYATEHVKHARLFNVERMKQGEFPELPKDTPLYVYCRSGNRSAQAAELLRQEGFNNITDLGALADLKAEGYATEKVSVKSYEDLRNKIGGKPIATRGNESAPITFVKYSDFKCPFSLRFTMQTEPRILKDYVDTGLVKMEYYNAAYQGDDSLRAAQAGYCANEQQKFWAFHDNLNAAYAQNQQPHVFASDNLIKLASQASIDKNQFADCLDSGKYANVVLHEALAAQADGIDGTPTFQIGSQQMSGALPFDTFAQVIDSQIR